MLTVVSRRFPVLSEVSFCKRTFPNRKEMEQGVTLTLVIISDQCYEVYLRKRTQWYSQHPASIRHRGRLSTMDRYRKEVVQVSTMI